MRKQVAVLTVALLLVVGAGLLLVFINRVRQTAYRQGCRNNLRGLGLALANYHEMEGAFPRGTIPNPDLPVEKRLSWLYRLDPYLHARMSPLYRQGLTHAWDAPENREI